MIVISWFIRRDTVISSLKPRTMCTGVGFVSWLRCSKMTSRHGLVVSLVHCAGNQRLLGDSLHKITSSAELRCFIDVFKTNCWTNNRVVGDLRWPGALMAFTVMLQFCLFRLCLTIFIQGSSLPSKLTSMLSSNCSRRLTLLSTGNCLACYSMDVFSFGWNVKSISIIQKPWRYLYLFETNKTIGKINQYCAIWQSLCSYELLFSSLRQYIPDSKVQGANMGSIWALLAPDGPHVDPMNLAIRDPTNYAHGWHRFMFCCG